MGSAGATVVDVAAAARAFGLGVPLAAPAVAARGQQGLMWRVETSRGSFAVKELLAQVTERDVAVDVGFQVAMRERGVNAPQPLRTPSGAVLAPIGDCLFRASTWVDLQGPRTDVDPRAVGAVLAILHRDPIPDDSPVDPWYTDPVPDAEWQDVADRLLAARAPFAVEFVASVPHFRSLQHLFRPTGPTQLCHRDLWADNLRLTTGGAICIIDWDGCGAAEAAQELAMPLVELCQGDADSARYLYTAYRQAGGPGRITDRGDFTMVLAQFGHFAITAGRQWLEATDGEGRARAESWFREGWDSPFGVRHIDELLAAIRDV